MLVIDGENLRLGRLGTIIAKELMKGEEVHLINSEKMIITGNKKQIVDKFITRRNVKNKANPEHSPHWPRVPRMLVKRMLRGMLPWNTKRGREAYKRLRVHEGVPGKLGEAKKFPELDGTKQRKYLTVSELCRQLGYNA